MARKVILHIGLHKTGTRFLQRMVFAQLDPSRFAFNPQPLKDSVRRALRHTSRDANAIAECKAAVQRWRDSDDDRTLVISSPTICGDMYSSYEDYRRNLELIKECFPEAEIIYFVRKQSDWLQSAYRQHLAKGKAVPIEVFLNFYDGGFQPRLARFVHGTRNLEPLNLPFLDIYKAYAEAFGSERVHIFRQEDLKRKGDKVKAELARILGLENLPAPPRERQQNRSYSALAIELFHPGTRCIYRTPTAEDIGEPGDRPYLIRRLRKFRRILIQHGFDKLVYRDWDLLARGGMRAIIESHYAEENAELERIAAYYLGEQDGPRQHKAPKQTSEPELKSS